MNVLWWLEFPLDQAHSVFRWLFLAAAVSLHSGHERLRLKERRVRSKDQGSKQKKQHKETSSHSSHSAQHWHCWLCGQSRYCCPSMPALWAVTHWHTWLSQLSQGTRCWRRERVHLYLQESGLNIGSKDFSPSCSHSLSWSFCPSWLLLSCFPLPVRL